MKRDGALCLGAPRVTKGSIQTIYIIQILSTLAASLGYLIKGSLSWRETGAQLIPSSDATKQ